MRRESTMVMKETTDRRDIRPQLEVVSAVTLTFETSYFGSSDLGTRQDKGMVTLAWTMPVVGSTGCKQMVRSRAGIQPFNLHSGP